MKKISILLAALMLVFIMPMTALAQENNFQTDLIVFEIDNAHTYEGMDKAYKDGYMPSVKDGKVTVILPLIANDEIRNNTISVTPSLGDTVDSPFVYSNYQKKVNRADNTVAGGGIVSSFLVRFDFPLASGRNNGVYPVTIDVQAQSAGGTPIQQTFTAYVTITDGKNPNAVEPPPKPEKPTSEPKVIVSGYSLSSEPVMAGEEFTATVTLKNTSRTKSVQNMTVIVSCDSPDLLLKNESDTVYISNLGKEAETRIELKYKADLDIMPQLYTITLTMQYDNSDATVLSSLGTVPVIVGQPLKVQMDTPQIPSDVNAGDTFPLSVQVMNMGRSKVYNVRCELSVPGLLASSSAFIGNMEAGTATAGEMSVFVGTKNMSDGYEGSDKYGNTSGKITLIYEDQNGQQFSQEIEVKTKINEPVMPVNNEPEEEPEKAGQWWISILIGVAVIAGLAGILIIRAKKVKKNEAL